jgi:hypothetical protein
MATTVTKRLQPIFAVHQYPDDAHTPWIEIQNATADQGFPPQMFGFELKPETSFEQAVEIAAYLNSRITDFTCTF